MMVGRGQGDVVRQVHDAGPGFLVNKIGRPRTFAAYERENLVGQEVPLKAKVFLKWRFRHGLPRDIALPDRQARSYRFRRDAHRRHAMQRLAGARRHATLASVASLG
jgi:hypothetical protein